MRPTDGNPEALYELALVLVCANSPYDHRAAALATPAAATFTGPSPTSALLPPDATLTQAVATNQARVLAHAANRHGDHDAARVFSYCEARGTRPTLQAQPPLLRD